MKSLEYFAGAILLIALARADGGSFTNPTLDSQAPYFVRDLPNPGFWGTVPPVPGSLFDSTWDAKGFQQIYNLNSRSPFAGNRGSGFDSVTKVFNPIGPSRFEFFPTQSNFLTEGDLGAYTYDVNEPRMRNIVKNYFRFFNKDLDRLSGVLRDNTKFQDLNNNEVRKLQNPDSFNYKLYFDGNDEVSTNPAFGLTPIKIKTFFPQSNKARELRQEASFEDFKKNLGVSEEDLLSGRVPTAPLDRLNRLEAQLHRIERKLELLEEPSLAKKAAASAKHAAGIIGEGSQQVKGHSRIGANDFYVNGLI